MPKRLYNVEGPWITAPVMIERWNESGDDRLQNENDEDEHAEKVVDRGPSGHIMHEIRKKCLPADRDVFVRVVDRGKRPNAFAAARTDPDPRKRGLDHRRIPEETIEL